LASLSKLLLATPIFPQLMLAGQIFLLINSTPNFTEVTQTAWSRKIGKKRIERRKEVVSTNGVFLFLLLNKERLLMVRRISNGQFLEVLVVSSQIPDHTRDTVMEIFTAGIFPGVVT
jgi:hypothetical protein